MSAPAHTRPVGLSTPALAGSPLAGGSTALRVPAQRPHPGPGTFAGSRPRLRPLLGAVVGTAVRLGRTLVRDPGLAIASLVAGTIVLLCFAPGLLAGQDPYLPNNDAILSGPSAAHLFGTDQLGRDVFSRVVHGTQITMSATLLAVAIAFFIGTGLGVVAGYVRGFTEAAIMRSVDVLLAVPALLMTMVIVAALGYGTLNVAVAVGAAAIANFARVMRSEVLRVSESDYVEAALSTGVRPVHVLWRHVLPNSLNSVLSLVPLQFGTSILAIAALGFLGFGAPPPQPEWGLLVAEGRDLLAVAPWIGLLPGLVILVTVLSSNRLSRAFHTEVGVR